MDPEFLTVKEAARALGVTLGCFYKKISRGEIQGVRYFGRAIRIHRPTFIQGHTRKDQTPCSTS